MKVTGISVYPIKGTAEIALGEAEVHRPGLADDRRWMVVDDAGQFLQQRVEPKLARVRSSLNRDGSLVIAAPEMPDLHVHVPPSERRRAVTVWRDAVDAADAGSEAADWFSQYLRRACRLVYMDRAAHRPVDRRYGRVEDVVSFADAAPLLLASEASLADLNRRIGRSLPMSRFRPNLTVDGRTAWEEDRWKAIRVGEVEFEVSHPCARCVVTTIDQQSAEKDSDGEPLRALAAFRRDGQSVYFGQNLIPRSTGTIRLGDPVTV